MRKTKIALKKGGSKVSTVKAKVESKPLLLDESQRKQYELNKIKKIRVGLKKK